MAIRKILTDEDPVLHKVCKPVEKFDERLWQLLDDMADTLHAADGVGLAAPQVGVVRRLFIMDTGDGLKECINPKILESRHGRNPHPRPRRAKKPGRPFGRPGLS